MLSEGSIHRGLILWPSLPYRFNSTFYGYYEDDGLYLAVSKSSLRFHSCGPTSSCRPIDFYTPGNFHPIDLKVHYANRHSKWFSLLDPLEKIFYRYISPWITNHIISDAWFQWRFSWSIKKLIQSSSLNIKLECPRYLTKVWSVGIFSKAIIWCLKICWLLINSCKRADFK